MLNKIAAALAALMAVSSVSLAQSPVPVKLKGDGLQDFSAYEMDGSFYTAPMVLTKGGTWKLSWEKDHLYVYVTPKGLPAEEKVEIPYTDINGGKYVDLSYFGDAAGLTYTYKDKKKELTIKKMKPAKKQKNHKKDNSMDLSSRPLVLWDVNFLYDPDKGSLDSLEGNHILSPSIGSYGDMEKGTYKWDFSYLKKAKDHGLSVMPLIHNDFEVKKTAAFMRDEKRQDRVISTMAALGEVYGLYGYNMDFENMDPKDKDLYTAFMKKLSAPLHDNGMKLTADITVYNAGSPTWSLCYDRTALSEYCDYEIIMGYDETPRTSKYAGSVSSYSWLDKNIPVLTAMVPPEKLILGLPFYTRVYSGNPGYMTSKTLAMKDEDSLLRKTHAKPVWQPDARQYTLTWRERGILHRVYLEEEKSLAAKVELLSKYHLAGLAFWRHGFEMDDIYGKLGERASFSPGV
ncbi:glycosyl hydrolase family 18 protein [uncultured Dialister sp.]|uniref:glycosyl hydrolase family 18 protein n=1 Tax=uncultured Dialister sp. TaxID=278064 RepID=UPI0025F970DE|nr:glycosyl hydrolase family 18 protein [uncultured Dialister sp.]